MTFQPDLYREDELQRSKRTCRAFILREGIADDPAGITPGIGPETYRQYFERIYREAL